MKLCFRSDEPTGGLGDLFVRTSHRILSYSYSVRRVGLSTRRGTNKALDRSARSGVFDLCNVPSSHSVNAKRSLLDLNCCRLGLVEPQLVAMVFIAHCNFSMSVNNIRGFFTMRLAYLVFLLFATAFFQPHASAQEADPIGSVDAVFGSVEDKAIVIGSFDGEIPSGVYPATIEDVNGFLAVIDVEVDGDLNTVFGYIPSALIPNDGTPMQMNVYSDDSYSSFVSLLVFAADPPVYPGTPHQPKKANEPYEPTKVPVFRGGESFLPLKKGEIEVEKMET